MSISILTVIFIALFSSFVVSDDFPYPKDAPTNIDQCRDVIFNCDCGNPGYRFQAVFKQCHFWMSPEQACVRFQNCLECEDGKDRCISCPQGKYGRWCNGRCNCENGGTCNKVDGSCFCPPGYNGQRCEIRKTITIGELNCHTKANTLMKQEKNLQINATCPRGCKDANGEIWGTSIYTADSSVCRAAIHAGILNNNGGKVTIVDNGIYFKFISTTTTISSKGASKTVKSFRFENLKAEERRSTCPQDWIENQDTKSCSLFSPSENAWKIHENCLD